MIGRGGRFVAVAVLAALVTLCAFTTTASAAGTDVFWATKLLPWASYGAGTAATGDSLKWQHITDENDSTRTAFVETRDWAWDVLGGAAADPTVQNIAYLTCACQTNNLAAGNDSLYVMVEKRAPNGEINYNATMTAAIGTVLTLQGAGSANGSVFRGQLQYNSDILETLNVIGPGTDFRLVLKGDQGSTTPAMGKCSMYITYPKRALSSP